MRSSRTGRTQVAVRLQLAALPPVLARRGPAWHCSRHMSISPALLPGRFEAWAGGYLARALVSLPAPVVRRLAGTPPPEATGLHPEALLLGKLATVGRDPMSDGAPV